MNQINLKKLQKTEAIRRLKEMKYFEEHLKEFIQNGTIFRTEPDGIEFFLSEEEQKQVFEFENKYKTLVFHVIKSDTEFGTLYSFLYVSKYENEWENDLEFNKSTNEFTVMSYVLNISDPECSEFGSIRTLNLFGGIIRTA